MAIPQIALQCLGHYPNMFAFVEIAIDWSCGKLEIWLMGWQMFWDRRGHELKGQEFGKGMVEGDHGAGFRWCKIDWVTHLAVKESSHDLRSYAHGKIDKSQYTSTARFW
ncbi:hypothetical protein K435DRAFT_869585 [Dendrothele bispora CBS 962.96]|uniref:Uncharacterized protein n=1 Tax=Dendrothele bispora (strain CBS 962.96) TaxID=1314807 RepID=A0A4S8L9H6_DENBC|nr:hypothetical protein K435DRAFT_869585 [Dendrothele bispora CBS 962.96]